MKREINHLTVLSAIFALIVLFSAGCSDDCEQLVSYTYYKPVYITTEQIRENFRVAEPETISIPGKIYILGEYLFVNEVGEGIHIIDNSDKRNPQKISFINIPGNHDMAAKGNILYADSYVDLLAIDISDINNIRLVKRVEGVFQDHYYFDYSFAGNQEAVLVRYDETDTTFVDASECDEVFPTWLRSEGGFAVPLGGAMDDLAYAGANYYPGGSGQAGIGGSMARFTIVNEKLYTVGTYNLRVFDISDLSDPVAGSFIDIGWGIETIFPYENNLFIGAQNGMHIYDISNPEVPQFISTFVHVTSCDPVVVRDTIAFVTLRSGTECQGFTNQLDVIDIKNLYNPKLLKTYPMLNPHGLGVDENALFICEGDFGLKVFDAADINTISQNLIRHYEDMHSFDVIPFNDVLIMIGNDGLYQYDYSDLENMEQLSVLPIVEPAE